MHHLVRALIEWPGRQLPCDVSLSGDIAIFSADRLHRYVLTRQLGAGSRVLVTVGLNPSTADAFRDDPTIRRLKGFAASWECGLFVMLNAYGYRTPSPEELFAFTGDRVGAANADAMRFVFERIGDDGIALAAWGVHAEPVRVERIASLARGCGVRLQCLGTNRNGSPKHPLYIKGDTDLRSYHPPAHGGMP